ncbi:MAG: hypothetical protein AAGB31_11390 [Bdellovibrio sp.]
MKPRRPVSLSNESERMRQIVREVGLPLRQLPDIISASAEDCLAWWSFHKDIRVTGSHFTRLTQILSIDENQLYNGTYDRELARKRVFGDYLSLPERYEGNKNSFIRTSAHILRYITLTRGQVFADKILHSLNVSPAIYNDLNTQINLTYFADLLETLARFGFSQEELDTLASVNFLTLHQSELGKQFRQSESYFDIYQTLANNFHYFDNNFEYKSSFVGKKYILKTLLPLEQHGFVKEDVRNLKRLMRYRHLLLAWFPYLGNMSPLFPKAEEECHHGILELRYEIDLSSDIKPPLVLHVV